MILALGSVIALGILESLGIMLALSFLILGHAKHEKLLVALGALFLPAFLFSYYYMLDLNLMTKSGVLIGSGLLALTGAFYLHVKQLNAKN